MQMQLSQKKQHPTNTKLFVPKYQTAQTYITRCIYDTWSLNKSTNKTRLFSSSDTFLLVCRHSDGRRARLYKALLREGSQSCTRTTKSSQPSDPDCNQPVPFHWSGLFCIGSAQQPGDECVRGSSVCPPLYCTGKNLLLHVSLETPVGMLKDKKNDEVWQRLPLKTWTNLKIFKFYCMTKMWIF